MGFHCCNLRSSWWHDLVSSYCPLSCPNLDFIEWNRAKKTVLLTKAGTEKVSETNMREFMIAILEENDKS